MTWVIEYQGSPLCWIAGNRAAAPFDVTFQKKHAQTFTNREDASCEMLRLGLSGQWEPRELRSYASQED